MPQRNVRCLLLCIFLLVFGWQGAYSEESAETNAIDLEIQAKQLSSQWNGGAIHRSIALFRDASELWRQQGNRERESFCLREASRLSFLIANSADALRFAQRSYRIDRSRGDVDATIESLGLKARAQSSAGHFHQSERCLAKALKMAESEGSITAKAEIYLVAGELSLEFAKTSSAMSRLLKAKQYAELSDSLDLKASVLIGLGITTSILGDKEGAIEMLSRALKLSSSTGSARSIARTHNALGYVYTISNEKQKALVNYLNALTLIPPDVDFLEQAKSANGIATIYAEYGQENLAEEANKKALEAYKKASNLTGQLATLPSIAYHLYRRGDYHSSRKLLKEGLSISRKVNYGHYSAVIQETLGNLEMDRGNTKGAIKYYQGAMNEPGRSKVYLPIIQNKLGKALEKTGNNNMARSLYKAALKRNRKTKDVVHAAANLFNLANSSAKAGELDTALKEISESVSITETLYRDVGNGKLRSSFLSSSYDRYELLISLSMKKHQAFPGKGFDLDALRASEKVRSRMMLEHLRLSQADFRADADPDLLEQEKEVTTQLDRRTRQMTVLIEEDASKDRVTKLDLEIARLDLKQKELTAAFKQKSPVYSALRNPPSFDPDEFRKRLDENTLFLEFSLGKLESYVWVIGKTGVSVFILPGREVIETRTDELLDLIGNRQKLESEKVRDFQYRTQVESRLFNSKAQELSNLLFGQMGDLLGTKRLVIVADGTLNYFPISALPVPQREGDPRESKPFLVQNEIVYQPSAMLFQVISENSNRAISAPGDLLVFADAVYSKTDGRYPSTTAVKGSGTAAKTPDLGKNISNIVDSLHRLGGSGLEAEAISTYFDPGKTRVTSGFDASRSEFLDTGLDQYKILHFATHGVLNEERPELSGLVLSRYSKDGSPQNGFVRLHDIYRKKLSADLVVLSACETGIGKDIKGEGLMSLTNGFLEVGAKTVVSSRWKVDDRATLHLMRSFYKSLSKDGMTPAAALRQAQIDLYRGDQYSSPHYWAAFAAHGEYLYRPQFAQPIGIWPYLLLCVLVMSVFGELFYLRRLRQTK